MRNHIQLRPEKVSDKDFSRRQMLGLLGGSALTALGAGCASSPPDPPGVPPLHYQSLLEVAESIRSKQVSPVELTRMMLDRIEAVDGRLHSYATVMTQQALAAALEAEKELQAGNYRGPLHGIPVAVKDLCYTRGVRTMGGLKVLSDFVPDSDATVISKLKNAGAVLLGKLNLTEGAMGGYHPDFEIPVNPWNEALWSGASSSGSGVATAAGLCFASLGSDTGGSIRFPSMANGIVGLKPTYGRVSRYGVLPLAESLDHVGPMARRTADAAVVLEAISGSDPEDPTSLEEVAPRILESLGGDLEGIRVGLDREYVAEGIDADLVAAIERALGELETLGARVINVKMPAFGESERNTWFTICSYEAHSFHQANYPSRAPEYGEYFREFLEMGSVVSREEYAEASQRREEYNRRFTSVLDSVDAVACPAGGSPFEVPQQLLYGSMSDFAPVLMPHVHFRFTVPADFAGTPSLTLPCGLSPVGPPFTIQFLGGRLSELTLCRIGHAYERVTSWHELHPQV